MSSQIQRSFQGGEIAPALYARTDQSRYATGLRQCRNLIVRRHGGVTIRPGTTFSAEVKDSTNPVQIKKFVLDPTNVLSTYLIEFGNRYARFIQNGVQVQVSGVAAWVTATAYAVGDLVVQAGVNYTCTSAHTSAAGTNEPGVDAGAASVWYTLTGTIYEIPTPYVVADLAALQLVQANNVITLVHPSYPPCELTWVTSNRWIIASIAFGPALPPPTNLALAGGAAGALTYWAVTALLEGSLEESLPAVTSVANKIPSSGTPTVVTWNPVPGASKYNVYRSIDGSTYGLLLSTGGTTLLVTDNTWSVNTATISTTTSGVWVQSLAQVLNPLAAISATNRAFDGNYTVYGEVLISAVGDNPGSTDGRVHAYYSRNGEPMVDAGSLERSHFQIIGLRSFTRAYHDTIQVPDNGYTTLSIYLVAEVLGTVESGVPTFACTARETTAGDDHIDWGSMSSGFTDAGAVPDYSQGPPSQPAVFNSSGRYPSTVAYYQQRRLFANSVQAPQTVWGSRTASPGSFSTSTPLQADDAISFGLVGREVAAVKHMLDLARLLVFTTGSVMSVDGGASGILTPDGINPRKLARQGIGRLAPLQVDDAALYVEARGTIIRDLQPMSAAGNYAGYYGSYSGSDLTVFAVHLFSGFTIADWDYAETPHSIIWAVRSDGTLLGLTYIKEQGVWGWHRHDTNGVFENVCVVPEGIEDAVYVVVRRTISGVTKRYIERFGSLFFTDVRDVSIVDSSTTYDGRETGTRTMTLTGGVNWDQYETLTLIASLAAFVAGDVGNAIFLTGPVTFDSYGVALPGNLVRATVTAYTSSTIVTVRSDRLVPVEMRGAAIGNSAGSWSKAVTTVTGLSYLNGEEVSVVADGYVKASPNNPSYPVLTVVGGAITLDGPYAVIHVGLPYIADLETLDLDSPGPMTRKDKPMLVSDVIAFFEDTRGVWVGRPDKPTADLPLNGLEEMKPRQNEPYDSPPGLVTFDKKIPINGNWNTNGRILIRQVDPLPMTVLSVAPIGYLGA